MAKLSEQEKAELLEMARSESLRREFRSLRAAGRAVPDLDRLLAFLTFMSRLAPTKRRGGEPRGYTRAYL